jgi:hypothetical protein
MRDQMCSVGVMLMMGMIIGCGDDKADETPSPGGSDSGWTSPDEEDTGGSDTGGNDTGSPEEEAEPIGSTVGDLQSIDHAFASRVMTENLAAHIDELDEALTFLEDSELVARIIDLLSDDDEDEDSKDAEEDEGFEIDLSELRDGAISFLEDKLMVESTASVSDDGLTISYAVSPEFFCVSDDEDIPPQEAAEDEADCAEMLMDMPLSLQVVSDGDGRVNVDVLAGTDLMQPLSLQVHDDLLAVFVQLPDLRDTLQTVFGEDIALPDTMAGRIAGEVRREGEQHFSGRFAVQDDVEISSASPDSIAFTYPQALAPGSIVIDGIEQTIIGSLDIETIDLTLPWEDMASIFQDDEDGEESPEASGEMVVFVPAIQGDLALIGADDTLRLSRAGLGEATTTISVNADTIIAFDLNPQDGREIEVEVSTVGEDDVQLMVSPLLDAQVAFSMHHIDDVFDDLPDVLADDTIGVLFDDAQTPTIQTLTSAEGTELQILAGTLTLWSDAMASDVIIEEGMCIGEGDESSEDDEDQHDLFGGLTGVTCGQ